MYLFFLQNTSPGPVFAHVLNQAVLALLTNRTLVWAYNPNYNPQVCDAMLHRSNWMAPSTTFLAAQVYKYRQKAALLEACQRRLWNWNSTIATATAATTNTTTTIVVVSMEECRERFRNAAPSTAAQLATTDLSKHAIVELLQASGCGIMVSLSSSTQQDRWDWSQPACAAYLQALFPGEIDPQRVQRLFRYGVDFLYGMVFRHTFDLTAALLKSTQTYGSVVNDDDLYYSVALHTPDQRNNNNNNNNNNASVEQEKACLDKLLSVHSNAQRRQRPHYCQVFIMSDYNRVKELAAHVQQRHGCQSVAVVARAHRAAAVAFWEGLALLTQARHGFIGKVHSSSLLLQSVVVYDSSMTRLLSDEKDNDESRQQPHEMEICTPTNSEDDALVVPVAVEPEASGSPDTMEPPPFVYNNVHVQNLMNASSSSRFIPEPLQVLHEYISQHGISVLGNRIRSDQKYIRMQYFCPVRCCVHVCMCVVVVVVVVAPTMAPYRACRVSPQPVRVRSR